MLSYYTHTKRLYLHSTSSVFSAKKLVPRCDYIALESNIYLNFIGMIASWKAGDSILSSCMVHANPNQTSQHCLRQASPAGERKEQYRTLKSRFPKSTSPLVWHGVGSWFMPLHLFSFIHLDMSGFLRPYDVALLVQPAILSESIRWLHNVCSLKDSCTITYELYEVFAS
jgi:hypothetical protein